MLTLSNPTVKIFNESDVVPITNFKCLKNQSYAFQVFFTAEKDGDFKVKLATDLDACIYQVLKLKGDYYYEKNVDDYYVYRDDHMYPELLRKVDTVTLKKGETATLYISVSDKEKTACDHDITVLIGDEKTGITLTVLDKSLVDTDLKITHWLHMDGICRIYNVAPFTKEFYDIFDQFLTAYVGLGNTMALVPMFTPPLDTAVGGERLTVQLVKVDKINGEYKFDLSKLDEYIDFCTDHGIKYFELSHLFTQWGGEFCPKVIATVDGKEERIFGWDISSESAEYQEFLTAYMKVFVPYLENKGIKDKCVMHLTDEPHGPHVERYVRLSKFIKSINGGITTFDALSHYDYYKLGAVDLPAVTIGSSEYDLFDKSKILAYYCCSEHENYLTNRFFHMPLSRTETLGQLLYNEGVKGFLQWGYNFYNKRLSVGPVNPYEDTTAGPEGFPAGDSFLVYPGEKEIEYSIRYFAIKRSFEDYRLLKTLETVKGRDFVINLLREFKYIDRFNYQHNPTWVADLRTKIYEML